MPLTHKNKTRTELTVFYWRIISTAFLLLLLISCCSCISVIRVDLVWGLSLPATGNVLTNPENILTSSHKRDWNFLGIREGSVRLKYLKKCTKLDWKFSRSGSRGIRNNPFCGGGVDIFWNCTIITLKISTINVSIEGSDSDCIYAGYIHSRQRMVVSHCHGGLSKGIICISLNFSWTAGFSNWLL